MSGFRFAEAETAVDVSVKGEVDPVSLGAVEGDHTGGLVRGSAADETWNGLCLERPSSSIRGVGGSSTLHHGGSVKEDFIGHA